MIADAITTTLTLAAALLGWVIVLATVAAISVLAAIVTGAWGARAVWRRVDDSSWGRQRPGGRIPVRSRDRAPQARTGPRTPAWAHSQPLDYEEAA